MEIQDRQLLVPVQALGLQMKYYYLERWLHLYYVFCFNAFHKTHA